MSDESSDCSDVDFRPSGSSGRQQSRLDQKKKRRIVMRIEFEDSDDSTSASDHTSDDEVYDDKSGGNDLNKDDGPSCSVKLGSWQKNTLNNDVSNDIEDSDELQRNAATHRLRHGGRRNNILDAGFSDGSTSGSEINHRRKVVGKKYVVSEDEREPRSPSNNGKILNAEKDIQKQQHKLDEQGFTSDSSSSDLLEKCPICLLSFRQQEIGSPSTCKHIFCANCIEAWSKNVQTCPIDRNKFQSIIVRESFENRNFVREINVDPNAKKDFMLENEIVDEEDATYCGICNRPDREDVMLLCDHCNHGYHMDCLTPQLFEIPEGAWFCDNCVDSEEEEDEDDLNMLYEDIRDMGIPQSSLRVREVQQPRILRTRQNERIRAAILRRTRASISRLETTTTTTTTNSSTSNRGRPRMTTTTTTTTRSSTTNRNRSAARKTKRKTRKVRRRRNRHRTYVVEYDLNNFDEKFAIKTTKKVIKKRRKRRRALISSKKRKTFTDRVRMTASKRLAEQMGVKPDPKYTSHLSGSAGGLSLFGGANDLEYFSDSDNDGNIESEIHIDTGHGTAVQTSVRISSYGSQRSRKNLVLGRLQQNRGIAEPVVDQSNSNPDILSSIMDIQERWHSASRNLESVHINTDGTLNLPANTNSTPISPAKENKSTEKEKHANGPNSSDINQAPMYSRGGGNANFNRGGSGYNNRSNSQSNYRGGGGAGSSQYRHSTGGGGFGGSNSGSNGGINFNMVGRGNFNFSNNPNYNGPLTQPPNMTSPFQQRNFNQQQNKNNQRNNNNNNQQRNSLPFTHNMQPQQQQHQQNQNNPYAGGMIQTSLPPPPTPHLLLNQQQTQQTLQPPHLNENSLFGGLPPPMSIPPPHLNVAPPVLMTVPPPPAPPSVVIPPPINSSLFQLNSDYGNNDDDSNCPNFAIYSQESLQVAQSSEIYPTNAAGGISNTATVAKEDDENEDLVQLDDDDEIPMPPDPIPSENVGSAELYEPENPTEENDDDDEDNVEVNKNESFSNNNNVNTATKDDGDDYGDDNSDEEENGNKNSKDKDNERKQISSEKYDPEEDILSECGKDNDDEIEKDNTDENQFSNNDQQSDTVRSPSPAVSEIRLPECETAAANRKGVLELYDDSDWEELDIDRPKDVENKGPEKIIENSIVVNGENEENDNVQEQDRSYTPCLDENNEPEEPENENGTTTPLMTENCEAALASVNKVTRSNRKDDQKSTDTIENMDTELISDEEDELDRTNKERRKNRKSVDKRSERRDNEKVETFKKIGNKQKGRNYRGEKQPSTNNKRRTDKRRKSSRSRSRSRSVDSFRSRGARSRTRSPRFRSRVNRSRSRSRSNNKENQGRWGGNFRDGGRLQRNNQFNQNNRLKRRELPRYDVRNVVGHHSPPKTYLKDRYGRDTSRNRRSSRSLSRARRGPPPRSSFSRSRSRNRRLSISLSPSPPYSRRRSLSPRPNRQFSPPVRRRSASACRRTPSFRQRSRSPLRVMRSRSVSPGVEHRMNGRKVSRHLRRISPSRNLSRERLRSRSISLSPRYTPRLSRSRSKTPRPKGKKKKAKESRKKKSKRRIANMSPSPNRRITRQPDPFEIEKPPKKKRRRSPRTKPPIHHEDHGWSPSPSPPPQAIEDTFNYHPSDKNVSWTPPMQSPLLELFTSGDVRSVSRSSRKDKNKRSKKKKKSEKRRDGRKEKKRKRRTETPEPAPSKEVFASGNNILVSVSFNKESTTNQQHAQQTIVTLPPNREDLLSNRRTSVDCVNMGNATSKKRKEKRKKIDTKPVAIIDLERSPFQVEQEPTDVIVLTDSEEALDREQRDHRRDRRCSESCPRDVEADAHRIQRSGASNGQRGEKSPEHLDTIHEESYDLTQIGGPKTPPEPPVVKFNLQTKKQNKVRNPLHEEDDDLASDAELNERQQQQQQQESHRSDLDTMHVQSSQKIGPNTPPESGPCSPDAYDPFEPTKSPSISPRSPTPPPSQLDVSQNTICSENGGDLGVNQKHMISVVESEQRREQIPGLGNNVAQSASLNPVDLVMALINSKSSVNNTQDLASKSNDSQHIQNMGGVNSHDDAFRDKTDEGNAITVLSNLLITSSSIQHIPSISSPTPPTMSKKILPGLPKIGGSVGGSSSSGVNIRNGIGGTSNNADDSFNVNDIESPYSPGSADYEDLFEPPPDTNGTKRRSKRTSATIGGKQEVFDNLFGSSSPIGNMRLPSYTPSKKHKGTTSALRKSKIKVGKSNDDNIKIYDDIPNSAVELHVKDKFLRKLNRQERVVEEVKLVLKPRFNRKQITKDDYKEIMRRAVPKICHSKSGEIDPFKIKKLIEAYVKKFRSKHKKLNLVNTGQVSSAVKCAAYLKKL